MKLVKQDKRRLAFSDRLAGLISPEWGFKRARFRKMAQLMLSGYGSSRRSRIDRSWDTSRRRSIKTSMDDGLDSLRARAQELDEENAIANGLLSRFADNVVHTGIKPQAKTSSKRWNRQAEGLFTEWADANADVRGMSTFWELQKFVSRNAQRDGDHGTILLKSGALQLVESEDIATPFERVSDFSIVDGVEVNRLGKPLAFHVADFEDNESPNYVRIPARNFVFLSNRRNYKQTRGEPAFAQSARLFDQIDGLIEAVVAASQMAAMFGLVITESATSDGMATLGDTTDSGGDAAKEFAMEPAMVKFLQEGQTINQVAPLQPSQNYPEFLATTLRLLGLPFGVPLELLLLDFSRTNFSSARASLLQAYRTFQGHQEKMRWWNTRIWRWRISKFMKDGDLPKRDDAWRHRWIAPGWPWVDPEKEGKANMLALDGGWTDLASIGASIGKDYMETFEQRAIELAQAKKLGIPLVHSNATRDPGAEPTNEPPGGDDDE